MNKEIATSGSQKVIPENIRAKWRDAARDGYQAVPHSLFKFQKVLGLSNGELVTLLNILDFWWEAERKPWPSTKTLANRMGVDSRSVLRNLKRLEGMRYVVREPARDKGQAKQYNLNGLVDTLNDLVKSSPPRPLTQAIEEKIEQETKGEQIER